MGYRFVFGAVAAFTILTSSAMPAAAQTAPTPGGIYSIIEASTLLPPPKGEKNPSPSQGPISTRALMTKGIDGLLIHLRWNEISHNTERYDWTSLDDAIQLAMNHGKKFELGIVIGGAEPTWLFAPAPTGLGATHGTFQVNASSAGTCPTFTMAPPYDPVFLSAFSDLLQKLASHLRQKQTYAQLSLIKLFGLTTTTDEMRLPAVDHCPKGSDPVTVWQGLGYRPAKVEKAWNTMLQAYLQYFPKKSFGIGFIGVNAFPAIDAQGNRLPASEVKPRSAAFVGKLIADAGAAMPGHVAVGFDSLALDVPGTDKSYYSSRAQMFRNTAAAGAKNGWQTNETLGNYPGGGAACRGNAPCTSSPEFRAMLFQGIYPHGEANTPASLQGVYMELFPQNIVQWPNAVRDAHNNLANWNGAP